MTMEAEGAGEERLTFTFQALRMRVFLVLHIEGDAKKAVWRSRGRDGCFEMPIRAMLNSAPSTLEIYWAT